jgi:hypothetical protein
MKSLAFQLKGGKRRGSGGLDLASAFTVAGEGLLYGIPDYLLYVGYAPLQQAFKGRVGFFRHGEKLVCRNVKSFGKTFQHIGGRERFAGLDHGDIVGGYIGFFRKLFLGYAQLPAVFFQIGRQYFPDIFHLVLQTYLLGNPICFLFVD